MKNKQEKQIKRLGFAIQHCTDNDLIILTAMAIIEVDKRQLMDLVNQIINNNHN